ncbi:hypothetical protein JCGZ_19421 [Jatropha curcas]|uniref:GATA-type domain-containing protein n=2 Tax=Jatropha curcas TaxID=180498 RepID=A0A067L7H6_JATCU|nr:hypothetical protein JCGZ_19421 [Jatropha curcas]
MMMGGGGAATNNYGMGGGNYGMTGGGIATNNYEMGGGRAATNNYEMGGGGAATNNYEIGGGRAATNNYGMINRMGNAVMGNIGSNLLGGQNLNSWAYDMGSSSTGGILRHHQQYPTGIPAYQNINGGLTLPPFQAHSLTSYTLLDCSPFEARQTGKSSSVARRPRNGNNNNPYRRCTNCNTNDTPMWRKGPLGPKSLCNACGIKYQKEEGKRKAKEAAKDSKA